MKEEQKQRMKQKFAEAGGKHSALNIADVRLSVCPVCGKKFGEVKKCYNVKCTNPFQTEA